MFICLLDHAYKASFANLKMERRRWPEGPLILASAMQSYHNLFAIHNFVHNLLICLVYSGKQSNCQTPFWTFSLSTQSKIVLARQGNLLINHFLYWSWLRILLQLSIWNWKTVHKDMYQPFIKLSALKTEESSRS